MHEQTKNILNSPSFLPVTCLFIYGSGLISAKIGLSFSIALQPVFIFYLLFLTALFIYKKSFLISFFLLAVFSFCLGYSHFDASKTVLFNDDIYKFVDEEKEVTLLGKMVEAEQGDHHKQSILLETEKILLTNRVIPVRGKVLLSFPFFLPDHIFAGDNLLIKTRLKRINSFSNPGVFNYKTYLNDKNIRVRGWINAEPLMIKIDSRANQSFLDKIKYLPEKTRSKIGRFLSLSLSKDQAALYKAILIGDRSAISDTELEYFKKTGTMHLLAISGMHMSLLALLLFGFFCQILKQCSWLTNRFVLKKIAAVLSFPLLLTYAFIAGFNPPVQRALAMSALVIFALLANRQLNLFNSIILAAFVILFFSPISLFTASFQLSFAAIIAIALLYPIIDTSIFLKSDKSSTDSLFNNRQMTNWLKTAIFISIVAMLGTAPLSLFYFNRVSLISPISSLLVEPFLCLWALTIGLTATIFIPILPWFAALLFKIGSIGILISSWITYHLAQIPWSSLWLATPRWYEILLFYTILISTILLCRRKSKILMVPSLMIAIAVIVWPNFIQINIQNNSSATCLDVGNGSATFLRTASNHKYLIDSGSTHGHFFDIGRRIIAPFLWQQRITKLDGIIITHPHSDHFNGLPFILNTFKPPILWVNDQQFNNPVFSKLLSQAKSSGIKIVKVNEGDVLHKDANNLLEIVANLSNSEIPKPPNRRLINTQKKKANSESLICKYTSFGKTVLFPGDISAEEEGLLVKNFSTKLNADILISPHHGSPGSNSLLFLETVSPEYLIVSTMKKKNVDFLINQNQQFTESRPIILSSLQEGAISFIFSNNGITLETNGQEKRPYQNDKTL